MMHIVGHTNNTRQIRSGSEMKEQKGNEESKIPLMRCIWMGKGSRERPLNGVISDRMGRKGKIASSVVRFEGIACSGMSERVDFWWQMLGKSEFWRKSGRQSVWPAFKDLKIACQCTRTLYWSQNVWAAIKNCSKSHGKCKKCLKAAWKSKRWLKVPLRAVKKQKDPKNWHF